MFKNYFKTAWRNLWKNKFFSFINVCGLAIGIATCLLIILYVLEELSYDKYNINAGRIYRINNDVKFGDHRVDLAQVPAPVGPAVVRELPQAEQFTRFRWHGSLLVKKGNENLRETKVIYADSTLLNVFSLKLISGNPKTILNAPQTLLITESMAKKYFNRTDVAGETLLIDNYRNYKISGVIKDVPKQSHFSYDFFVPMTEDTDSHNEQDWLSENYNTYVLLEKGADVNRFVQQLDALTYRNVGPLLQSAMNLSVDDFKKQGGFIKNTLTPLTSIHLHSNKLGELQANSSYVYVYIFSAIALFILLIACVNFMNLSTAKSSNRAREVGVRKVLGSMRKNLMLQFLTESLLVSFISLVLAVIIAALLLPWFNNLTNKHIDVALLFQPLMLLSSVLLVLIVGLLAGSYPAFFLSALKPIEVLKGKLAGGFKGAGLRNALVVFQFAISIILIVGTIVIYSQLQYIRNKDIGYSRDKLLTIENAGSLKTQAVAFKNELKHISGISNVTMTSFLPVDGNRNSNVFFTSPVLDQKTSVIMQDWIVDENYIPTLNIKLLNGRNFSRDFLTDSNTVIINEAAAKLLGAGNLLNKNIYRLKNVQTKQVNELHIIGVVKNFNFNSLRDVITPLALHPGKDAESITVRLSDDNIPLVLAQVKNKWQAMTQGEPFTFSFMDEAFNDQYFTEQQTGKIFTTFAILAIFIACLGLFGLAAYAAEQRTKEIGIRKVLGATVGDITGMLSKSFVKLVVIASVIAFPAAWWVMNKWLQSFAYRIDIDWWIFLVAGVTAILIALITVSSHAIKAAMANPVKSLRTE
ncbi:MAG TPA: ABC transporter permease [Parafilimonas sp.]|nr:ABC transporter permease [Parafilimonas sp.]